MFRSVCVLTLALVLVPVSPFLNPVQATAGVPTSKAMSNCVSGLQFTVDPYCAKLMYIVWICFGMLTVLALWVSMSDMGDDK